MYFIYHKNGDRLLVEHEQYEDMIKTKEWFNSPKEAEIAADEELKEVRKKTKEIK